MPRGNEIRYIRGWKAIATTLNVTVEHLKVWHHKRPLPVSKLGEGKNAAILIEERDLLRWVRKHREGI